MPHLFEPLTIRGVTLRNRIGVSPMPVQQRGRVRHRLAPRAPGVACRGQGRARADRGDRDRASRTHQPVDLGIWDDRHVEMLARIAQFVAAHGAVPGMQLAHAGRKASRNRPGEPPRAIPAAEGGWEIVGPSPIAFADGWQVPHPLSRDEIAGLLRTTEAAARRALDAGFVWVELHAAHGYLCHSFYSPLSNTRDDDAWRDVREPHPAHAGDGASIRRVWPEDRPFSVRLTCTDWVDGGWTLEDTVDLARALKREGVDLIDCSSGGNVLADIPTGPGYQVPFAETVRRGAGIGTAAVGLITEPTHADEIVRNGRADLILLAREELRDPSGPSTPRKRSGTSSASRRSTARLPGRRADVR